MLEWLIPIVTIIVGILGPTLTVMALLHRSRSDILIGISKQVKDLDNCVDSVKVQLISYTGIAVTRNEVDDTLSRMRIAIAGDVRAVESRVTRLEGLFLVPREMRGSP